jgi:hypothetical protein
MTCEVPRFPRDDEAVYTDFRRCCSRFAARMGVPGALDLCVARLTETRLQLIRQKFSLRGAVRVDL